MTSPPAALPEYLTVFERGDDDVVADAGPALRLKCLRRIAVRLS